MVSFHHLPQSFPLVSAMTYKSSKQDLDQDVGAELHQRWSDVQPPFAKASAADTPVAALPSNRQN